MSKPIILSFTNQKGGVGKTTSAVNIAASLGLMNYKVLLADLDPQGNTTSAVGVNKSKLANSMYETLIGSCKADDAIFQTNFKNLYILPANINLAGAEFDILSMEDREYALKRALSGISETFDFIIIDCPPSLGMLTVDALSCSSGIVIPMQCEYFALEGLSQLTLTIKRVKQLYNQKLNITGILITMYNGRLNLSSQVLQELKKYYSSTIFKTTISRSIRVSEAPSFGLPIMYYDKTCKCTGEYEKVAKELAERIF